MCPVAPRLLAASFYLAALAASAASAVSAASPATCNRCGESIKDDDFRKAKVDMLSNKHGDFIGFFSRENGGFICETPRKKTVVLDDEWIEMVFHQQ